MLDPPAASLRATQRPCMGRGPARFYVASCGGMRYQPGAAALFPGLFPAQPAAVNRRCGAMMSMVEMTLPANATTGHAARPEHTWPPRRHLLAAAALLAVAGIATWTCVAIRMTQVTEGREYSDVYYSALLAGHDTQAALRKAHFRTRLLMREFGMSQSAATAEATRSVVWGAHNLCGGG